MPPDDFAGDLFQVEGFNVRTKIGKAIYDFLPSLVIVHKGTCCASRALDSLQSVAKHHSRSVVWGAPLPNPPSRAVR